MTRKGDRDTLNPSQCEICVQYKYIHRQGKKWKTLFDVLDGLFQKALGDAAVDALNAVHGQDFKSVNVTEFCKKILKHCLM